MNKAETRAEYIELALAVGVADEGKLVLISREYSILKAVPSGVGYFLSTTCWSFGTPIFQ